MFIEKNMPNVNELKKLLPLTDQLKQSKKKFDDSLKLNILNREKLIVVCGPCAADDVDAVCEYIDKLSILSKKYSNLLTVMRVYTSKPHSNGSGYRGMAFGDGNFEQGLLNCRKMMLHALSCGLPIADEILYPDLYFYLDDLISYAFIGARSSEDSLHRDFASGLEIPCGIKNGTDGSIDKVVDSLFAVANNRTFPYDNLVFKTNGNKNAHIVLRGGFLNNKFFENIDDNSVSYAKNLLDDKGLNNFLMVDLSHANSSKIAVNQIKNASAVKNRFVNGVMVESYLKSGRNIGFGTSKTDECLSFDDTEKLFQTLSNFFEHR